jgi:hypothetical protein
MILEVIQRFISNYGDIKKYMTDSKNLKERPTSGNAKIFNRPGGAIEIYIEQLVGKEVTLPIKERVKAIWNPEKEELIIRKWKEEDV